MHHTKSVILEVKREMWHTMAKDKSRRLANPFVYEGYKGAEYFCDRVEESQKLITNLQNGLNT